ncbi:MAG TPA: sensor histidine kinase [Lachnoclostridium sp.]|jgi:two-component system sensor histidine kinase YesM|uniref:sensor histidine kinase n=1 Tax=Lacrimispora sp. TaxID=2719234 RepID=UPI000EF10336|nr:sensor histidine kinase [Lacrimispora sp.]HCD43003.1 sensor histidine kinase [Lachnoclostridium sp.]
MKHLSFRMKLTLVFIITAMIEGAIIGSLSFSHSKDIVVKNKKQEMSDTINRIDININVKVRYIMEILDNAVASQLVRDACTPGWDDGDKGVSRTYLDDYCRSLIKSVGEQMDISIINASQVMYTTANINGFDTEYISGEIFKSYDDAVGSRNNKAVWTGIMPKLFSDPREEHQAVTVVRAIRDRDEEKNLGIMVIELDPDMFSNLLLGNQGLFQYQYLFILDQKGQVICSNPKINNGWQEEINDRFERGIRRSTLEWNGKRYYVCGQYNGITGWRSYSAIPFEGLFPQAGDLNKAIWLVGVVSTLGIAGVIVLLVYTMARPIKRLSKAMGQVQKGDFAVRVPNKRKDEIGELTESFNYMLEEINTLIRQVYQEKIAQKNAEVQALQAQINPHFLYNTLDSINWMLIDRGEYDISDIILSLAGLMRYSIEDENAFVPLEKEIGYVQCYLKIQKNRLEERLEYDLETEENLADEQVPKLILQPIVENAITHGIEPRNRKGMIRILIKDLGDEMLISVEDNGIGMTLKQLNHLRDEVPDIEREGHTGIGVRNVNRRIRLHYGEAYGISIESTYGKGTIVSLRIPKGHGTLTEAGGKKGESVRHEADHRG